MKNYLFLIALSLVITPAWADLWTNCTNSGGTIVTANSYGSDKGGFCNDPNNAMATKNCNGKRFCKGQRMHWWSAFTWCESIGGKLASFESMCPETQAVDGTRCANLTKTGGDPWVWANMGLGSNKALVINPNPGQVSTGWERNSSAISPFCEEN